MLKGVRPSVAFLLGAVAIFGISQPDAFSRTVAALSLPLAAGFFGAGIGRRLDSSEFARDATDAGAFFATLLLALEAWLKDHPIAYVPPAAFGGLTVVVASFAFVAVLFGLTQLYALVLFRLRRAQQGRRATA